MKLRVQMVISAGVATLPVILALLWYDAGMHHRAAQQLLIGYVTASMGAARERCAEAPELFGGILPPDSSLGRPPPFLPLPGQRQQAQPMPPIAFAYGPDFFSHMFKKLLRIERLLRDWNCGRKRRGVYPYVSNRSHAVTLSLLTRSSEAFTLCGTAAARGRPHG